MQISALQLSLILKDIGLFSLFKKSDQMFLVLSKIERKFATLRKLGMISCSRGLQINVGTDLNSMESRWSQQ